MSHLVAIDVEIHDLDALAAAATRLGLIFTHGQQRYRWYGRSVGDYPLPDGFTKADLGKCEHAISVPDNAHAYEIGVCMRRDGRPGYTLLWDFWGGGYGLEEKVGENAGLLIQAYTLEKTRLEAQRNGRTYWEETAESGAIVACVSA